MGPSLVPPRASAGNVGFDFLSSPIGAELTVRTIRIARAVMIAPAMPPFQVTEMAPGPDRITDDAILD